MIYFIWYLHFRFSNNEENNLIYRELGQLWNSHDYQNAYHPSPGWFIVKLLRLSGAYMRQ